MYFYWSGPGINSAEFSEETQCTFTREFMTLTMLHGGKSSSMYIRAQSSASQELCLDLRHFSG